MSTDIQTKWLAEQAYWVERNREDVEYHPCEGNRYDFEPKNPTLGQFQVLKAVDNPINGMQAMAVAPVVNGLVNYDNITIAYAGTNFWEREIRDENMAKMASRRTG
ncbi:TPA: hypothetical protein U1164_001406 [Streptococcus suis]|nr:hypothetical protein [Streptococcus suis]HEL2039105.1 hypothetical protein [Streptococcus suis]HEM4943506.1 hypothetical protein [Streptococcus suis]HEM5406149.1 hypothetical protein [Streptococcus suis]